MKIIFGNYLNFPLDMEIGGEREQLSSYRYIRSEMDLSRATNPVLFILGISLCMWYLGACTS